MAGEIEAKKKANAEKAKREIPQAPSSMFFQAVSAHTSLEHRRLTSCRMKRSDRRTVSLLTPIF